MVALKRWMFLLMLAGLASRDLMNIENQKAAEKPAEEAPPPAA